MKASKYNIITSYDDGYLMYNCISNSLIKISSEQYETYKCCFPPDTKYEIQDGNSISEFVNNLYLGRFIVDDDLDELEKIKMLHYITRFQRSNLHITIAPTNACNFRCIYCYEADKSPVRMSESTELSIVEYINSYLKAVPSIHSLNISWFGGEITLALDTVCRLSRSIMAVAAENKVNYKCTLATNGYIMNREIAIKLIECGITAITVTLDGPPEVHDKRRFLISGGGTFNTILKNIVDISDILKIVIICMVDKKNMQYIPDLINIVDRNGLSKKALLTFSRTMAYPGTSENISDSCLREDEYAKLIKEWNLDLLRRGFGLSKSLPIISNYANCRGLGADMVAFDAEGYMYRCTKTIWNKKERMGHVSKPDAMNSNHVKWMAWDPFADENCSSCRVLPLCMGSCPYISIQDEAPELHGDRCQPWKYCIEDDIKLMYEMKRGQMNEGVKV